MLLLYYYYSFSILTHYKACTVIQAPCRMLAILRGLISYYCDEYCKEAQGAVSLDQV